SEKSQASHFKTEEPDFWRPTLHTVSHYGQANSLAVVRQEATGDGWDVLGTMLACCAAAPPRPGLFPRLGARSVNALRRLEFAPYSGGAAPIGWHSSKGL